MAVRACELPAFVAPERPSSDPKMRPSEEAVSPAREVHPPVRLPHRARPLVGRERLFPARRVRAELRPAEADTDALRGRDGGFALVDAWRTQLTGLTAPEADALLFAALPGAAEELLFGALLDAAELKLVASLPGPSPSADAFRLCARFHLDPIGWFTSAEPVSHLETVAAATWAGERLALRYESRTAVDDRVVEPLGLVLKAGVWYLVASSRGRLRTFRLSNVLGASTTGHHFERPDDFDLATFWHEHAEAYERSRYRSRARLRVSPEGLTQVQRMGRAVAAAVAMADASGRDDGWFEVTIPIENDAHAAGS